MHTHACVGRHAPMQHHCWWNRYVANPIKKWGYVGKGRQAMLLLKREILARTLLRRTKVQCADVLALPPRWVCDVWGTCGGVGWRVIGGEQVCTAKK